ncbi:bifunctional demethylmenaquinone methyltransferase/2-methoxy-6-polyprenyl-1,4-benzoquinol methylase UbiE [uncultured Helicobacter sp.]|uniref:bifunctional demethylmenaquinone methyltransferase/2-methoxy-6-polyprenyl-1,4-benzoquinol methylase UbiE n=1 Tax=uncultured Helicobacter sp. TaxID=175537 RepID=UPI00374E656F
MQDKQTQIISMFDSIASTYDVANRAMSLGIDRAWRKEACRLAFLELKKCEDIVIADIACGSGDMITSWIHNAPKDTHIKHIYGYDPSQEMLKVAHEKLHNLSTSTIELIKGEAKALPFEDQSIDILSISFGLRNVLEYKQALDEFVRVLKPGGIVVILEFFKPQNATLLQKLMGFYTSKILPFVGGIISSNLKAYRYLPQSMRDFVSASELEGLMKERGMRTTLLKGYSANVATLYMGVKS